jgi:filamentous hemagglutinin family protein
MIATWRAFCPARCRRDLSEGARFGVQAKKVWLWVSLILFPLLGRSTAFGNPVGGAIGFGTGTIQSAGSTLTVQQASPKLIINWQNFSINQGETTQFQQPSASSAVLNRVIGSAGTTIEGSLTANGWVYLLNPNGVLIGPDGSVKAAGFFGSTLNLADTDFLNGNLHFVGSSPASVINNGKILATSGDIGLFGAVVTNSGSLLSQTWRVFIGGGQDITLVPSSSEPLSVAPSPTTGQIVNTGAIAGTSVFLCAAGGNPFVLAIDNQGSILATGTDQEGGNIVLAADANAVQDSGSLIATKGSKGGEILLTGDWAVLWNKALVRAEGPRGGGNVTLLANNVVVGQQAWIQVSAWPAQTANGDGGNVTILSQNATVQGTIWAEGAGAGNGGHLDIEGQQSATFGGSAFLSAGGFYNTDGQVGNGGTFDLVSLGPVVENGTVKALGGAVMGNGGKVNIIGGDWLFVAGLTDVSARANGNGGTVQWISQGENQFKGVLLANGGTRFGSGGSLTVSAGDIGVDFNGLALLDAPTFGNGGTVQGSSTGETAFTGAIFAAGGALHGNGGSIQYQSPKTLWNVGSVNLSSAHGKPGTTNVQVGAIRTDLFDPGTLQGHVTHTIVLVGENRTFDNLLATYIPAQGQSVQNYLSLGIINPDGTPGPNFAKAAQSLATDTTTYSVTPQKTGQYSTLPQPFGPYTGMPDPNFPANLPNGPFPIGKYVSYDTKTGDPVHRFFQMWQQVDGGKNDLFVWTATTTGIGPDNGKFSPTPGNTQQGGVAMGFYNVLAGEGTFFNYLAQSNAISDNYHQPIMGGTMANRYALFTGGVLPSFNVNGIPGTPPPNQIENPNPKPGTNNFYTQDGYQGGSYVNPSDPTQPGVAPIQNFLASLPNKPFQSYLPGRFYLVNNYTPAYNPDGSLRPMGPKDFTVPPQFDNNVLQGTTSVGKSWKIYIENWNNGHPSGDWDPLGTALYFHDIMTNPALRQNQVGIEQFATDVASGKLPNLAFITPGAHDGHPASSTPALLQSLVTDVMRSLQSNKKAYYNSALFLTVDEGGGYHDSGYIQFTNFFGDGTRIPLFVVSPAVASGTVNHTYANHVSIDKFIEANLGFGPLSTISLDNLPNPMPNPSNPYVPLNPPAISDLRDFFGSPVSFVPSVPQKP